MAITLVGARGARAGLTPSDAWVQHPMEASPSQFSSASRAFDQHLHTKIQHPVGASQCHHARSVPQPDARALRHESVPAAPDRTHRPTMPFTRLSRERVDTSQGSGLSIARSVAHAHNGSVTAKPRGGGRLILTVRLSQPNDSPTRTDEA